MSLTVSSQQRVALYDVSTQTAEKSIWRLINKYSPKERSTIKRGTPYCKNGQEMQRIYITLDKPESVDQFMRDRSGLRLNGEHVKVKRSLPNTFPLYDRDVTGIKIMIDYNTSTGKLNENYLKKYFQQFGKILDCKWTNEDRTEALFRFENYDIVDQIILHNTSAEIKGIKINLEKSFTIEDYPTYERSYVIHVTNLPVRVTSEEIATHFKVPIAVVLLNSCFRLEQHLRNGRTSSEAWIKNFSDEKAAQALAKSKTGTFLHTNTIECRAMLEPIDKQEPELCENFQKGQCPYTMDTCHFKHYSCSETDTCDDKNCWLGHTNKRTTVSIDRVEYRSEDAPYRVRFSNLPPNVTHEGLMARLKLNSKYSHHLILQPTHISPGSSRMAYLIRQPSENRLRHQIDKWHDTSYSSLLVQKIQCQLEINQEHFEWNDSIDITQPLENSRCPSPTRSTHSAYSNNTNRASCYRSAASTSGWRQRGSKKPHPDKQLQVVKPVPMHRPPIPKPKQTTNSLKSKSIPGIRQPPSDLSSLSTKWHWTKQIILNDQFDHDEMYWVETESNKEKNVVTKIYVPQTDRNARIRARRERVALNQLTNLDCVPKLLDSNVDISRNDQSNKELWTIMKLFNGERLSDYIKDNKPDFREALYITRQLLNMIKQIHGQNVIHRDIQPKNILIQQRTNINEMNLMLINFSSSWINNYQWTHPMELLDEQVGNTFYRMPQFENHAEQNDTHQQMKQFQYTPSIDATGICAILFWLITGHEPRQSQDICGQPPHKLHHNPKIIEKKINEMTAFRMEMKIHEHIQRHLMLIFDRCFAGPDQQLSVNELDYQLQFIISLIEGEKVEFNYFPPPQNPNNYMSIPLEDPFVYIVSLIHQLKYQFAARYSQCVRWSTEEGNRWSSQDGRIEHLDLLIFRYQTKNLSINFNWNIKMLRDKYFSIHIKTKINDKIDIEIPMGIWKIDQQTNHFDLHLKNFEMEIKILVNIICQSIALEK